MRSNIQYENKEKSDRSFDTTVRNVHLENVTSEKSQYGVVIIGLDDDKYVDNITIDNSTFNNVKNQENKISGARNVKFNNLKINNIEATK